MPKNIVPIDYKPQNAFVTDYKPQMTQYLVDFSTEKTWPVPILRGYPMGILLTMTYKDDVGTVNSPLTS